jgi:outer membrane protein OmpA-like peptidoglycan-associated protein
VIVHSAGGRSVGADRQQGDAVAKALVEAGANPDRLLVEAAGTAHPVLDPAFSRAPSRNERIEIVFVDPGG